MSCISGNSGVSGYGFSDETSPERTMADAKRIMQEQGHWSPNQQMGLRWPIGCVALEITQRCNLDCTLCYLSEFSEAVHDIPLQEIYHRIDLIHQHYGDHTDIQVTGGDPTLRKRDELISIVSYIRNKNMRSTLMTNGIRATRSLLCDLASAGLNDVAFHVDTTQVRKGFNNEVELNEIRYEYIQRAIGLGLSVVFNTTVHQGNFAELQDLVSFFIKNAEYIRTVSFQLQADTGRGIEGKRNEMISMDSVWKQIEKSAGTLINYKAVRTGHPMCNRYGMTVVVNNQVLDLFDNEESAGRLQVATKEIVADRNNSFNTVRHLVFWSFKHPKNAIFILVWFYSRVLFIFRDCLAARGRATTLSFFVHNFMDACDLDPERIQACVFKNMTRQGPVSMCEFNARRDEFILQSVPVKQENAIKFWDPLKGKSVNLPANSVAKPVSLSRTRLKGKARVNIE